MTVLIAEETERPLAERFRPGEKIVVTGPGIINAITAALQVPKNEPIANIGFCGSNKIPVGTYVIISKVETRHELADFVENPIELNTSGNDGFKCITSTDFVTESRIDEPVVYDMELAGIAAVRPDVVAMKCVSDCLNIDEYRRNAG